MTIVPGLAERVFPKKLTEDPLLPDAVRRTLSAALAVQADRVDGRAAGAAPGGRRRARTLTSLYPRIDLDQGRPRVPSFYALEVLRAAEGRLPGFDELARRAAGEPRARLGWPAPEDARDAIDDAEFDLAVLDRLVAADPETTARRRPLSAGRQSPSGPRPARAGPPLAAALDPQRRPGRSRRRPSAPRSPAISFAARSYSPTALQHFAACPYRFFSAGDPSGSNRARSPKRSRLSIR